jgi:tricorn protease
MACFINFSIVKKCLYRQNHIIDKENKMKTLKTFSRPLRQGEAFGSRLLLVLISFLWIALSFAEEPLMRFPDIHDNLIVFVSGEDIWSVPAEGGVATRLTIHDGEERYPKISPDGQLVAFTGEYDGNADVYVMNIYGGEITRLTYHPGEDQIVGWHDLKNKIIFCSGRHSYNRFERLYLIAPDGTGLEQLILHEAVQGSFSPDGNKIAYNKVAREHRTWKRYKGGLAQEIYLYDLKREKEINISNFEGTDRIPMWIGNKVFFSSDRERTLNIFAYDMDSRTIEKYTDHSEYDVRRPSMGGERIVYENGGDIWVLNTQSKSYQKVPIKVRADFPELRPYLKEVKSFITDIASSPSGNRSIVVARGDIFTIPKEEGAVRNLTASSGAREKDAVWSPDGKYVAYFSDQNGEYNLYIQNTADNTTEKLTDFKNGYRHTLRWSPDSKKIAFADQTLSCNYIDVERKQIVNIDKAEYENVDISLDQKAIYDFNWSPDSRYIAYSKMDADLVTKVYIYSLESGKAHCASKGLFNDFHPVFSTDGNYLFFVSNRRFDPTFCDFEWEMVYKNVAGIYALSLHKGAPSLLSFQSDEVRGNENVKETDQSDSKDVKVIVEFDGLEDRIEAIPVERGNYRYPSATSEGLFYLNKDKGDFNRFEFRRPGPMDLHFYSFDERKEEIVVEKIDQYHLSADYKHILYQKNNALYFLDADARNGDGKALSLDDLTVWHYPMAEWQQIFNEAWRMERDFYYEPNMHGLDWAAEKKKYEKLLNRATCRQDIRFVIGELIGELNTSHTYVYGGDRKRQAERVNVGLLGVDWQVDKAHNLYRFETIYQVPDWSREIYPPLAKPGVNVEEQDYLLKVNNVRVTADKNIYSYFQNLAGKQVTITVNDKPVLQGARTFVVKPLRNEYFLRYLNWVEHNRLVAEKASQGQIGYIHLPDTYLGSAVEFPKYFYSQTRKKGLIIDGRFNGGGLDPDIFLRRLDKPLHSYWTRRYSHDQTTPAVVTWAHKVLLTNRQAGSGGDELPYEFRLRKMGPIIGTRTWGGLVGVSMFISLIDGGGLTAPDYRIYDVKGKWVIENEGVEPDIRVDLHPAEMAREYDAQLQRGIQELMDKIKEEPHVWPQHEEFPEDK